MSNIEKKYHKFHLLALPLLLLICFFQKPILAADYRELEKYFIENRTESGLILDKASDRDTSSIAACGFGAAVFAKMESEGRLSREVCVQYINQMLDSIIKNNPPENKGWFTHFLHQDGRPKKDVEVSTIDSSLLLEGIKFAAFSLNDQELKKRVEKLIGEVDVRFMLDPEGYIRHGFYFRNGNYEVIPYVWDSWSEGIIAYKLFNLPFKSKFENAEMDLPIFVYFYPIIFYSEDQTLIDRLKEAVNFQTKKYGDFGFSATFGPDGIYQINNPDLISPIAKNAISYFLGTDEENKARDLTDYSLSRNIKTGQRSTEKAAIDIGSAYLLMQSKKYKKGKGDKNVVRSGPEK